MLDSEIPISTQVAPSSQVPAEMRKLMRFDPESGVITFTHGGASPELVREFIRGMANDLLLIPGAPDGLPVDQISLDGMVSRAMRIPKGMLLVGKIHKLDCINIVAKGDISILTETGSGRMVAGDSAVSFAGSQKMGFANEDTIFINIFRTDETSIAAIEDAIAWQTFDAYDRHIALALPRLQEG